MAGPDSACWGGNMQEGRPHRPRRRVSRRGWLLIAGLFAALLATIASVFTRLTPHVREMAVTALNERFDAETELATLQASIFPRPAVHGTGLVIRYKGRRDVAPLVSIRSFSASASIIGLMFEPLHLKTVDVEGLEIRVPPGGLRGHDLGIGKPNVVVDEKTGQTKVPRSARKSPIVIDAIRARAARLQIDTDDPGKLPRVFDIHDLELLEFAFDRAASFEARLTN